MRIVARQAHYPSPRSRSFLIPQASAVVIAGFRIKLGIYRVHPCGDRVDPNGVVGRPSPKVAVPAEVGVGGDSEELFVLGPVSVVAPVAVLAGNPRGPNMVRPFGIEHVASLSGHGTVVTAEAQALQAREITLGVGLPVRPQELACRVARYMTVNASRRPGRRHVVGGARYVLVFAERDIHSRPHSEHRRYQE